jgi:hypothetical protein
MISEREEDERKDESETRSAAVQCCSIPGDDMHRVAWLTDPALRPVPSVKRQDLSIFKSLTHSLPQSKNDFLRLSGSQDLNE